MDRLDTFSASCLVDSRIKAPVTANNLSKLRSWAHFEDGRSLVNNGGSPGSSLMSVNNPWATSWNEPGAGQWNSIVKTYPTCALGVDATVRSWLQDVPSVVDNLRRDGPWSEWAQNPIACEIGVWIHGVSCGGVYGGWPGPLLAWTGGAPDPQWGCPFPSTVPPPPPPPGCGCPVGFICNADGTCSPVPSPPVPASTSDALAVALILGGGVVLVGAALRRDPALRGQLAAPFRSLHSGSTQTSSGGVSSRGSFRRRS